MRKAFRFFRSMKFGMALLILVMLCSLAGSLIPQGEQAMMYVNTYSPGVAKAMIAAGITDIFHTWYFYALEALLCLNLCLCSLIRFPRTMKAWDLLMSQAEGAVADHPLPPEAVLKMGQWLMRQHYHRRDGTTDTIYTKNRVGYFGSFFTHLSILIVLIFGGLVLMTPLVSDHTVMPGSTLVLEDGTRVECRDFHIQDNEGRLDYASVLHVVSGNGSSEKEQEIRVNAPLHFGNWIIYQQTYGTAGQVQIDNNVNGETDAVFLTDPCFLSIDSQNGIYFNALYPGFTVDADGNYTLITQTSGSYADPVYSVQSISGGMSTSVLAFPDETLTIGDISFTFLKPVEYPGLRVKYVSSWLYVGLYVGFALMVIGLFLCFFTIPTAIKVTADGYAVCSPRKQGLMIELYAHEAEWKENT